MGVCTYEFVPETPDSVLSGNKAKCEPDCGVIPPSEGLICISYNDQFSTIWFGGVLGGDVESNPSKICVVVLPDVLYVVENMRTAVVTRLIKNFFICTSCIADSGVTVDCNFNLKCSVVVPNKQTAMLTMYPSLPLYYNEILHQS
jgi:hypothetical protein